jgi:GH43 family beta-xylosidase
MPKLSKIQMRDPFVLLHEGAYYLYGSTDKDIWHTGVGFDCYRSANGLEEFEGPFPAFRPPADFWSGKNFWAPEVYCYKDKFFMFATFLPKQGRRGTAVLRAESPLGPFEPVTAMPLTPPGWECLDGTLYEEDGVPYMVFCHEWQQVGDGQICAMPLTPSLDAVCGEPALLFSASSAKWASPLVGRAPGSYVTDGPFLHRAKDGSLLMLWSSFGADGRYCIGVARSESGRLRGPWLQEETPLYSEDGGHGMLFRAREGDLYLAIHSPNKSPNERPLFLRLSERAGTLTLSGDSIR